MSIKDMPHTTVEQVIRLRDTAIQLEAEKEKLQSDLRKERIVSDNLGKICDSQAEKIVAMDEENKKLQVHVDEAISALKRYEQLFKEATEVINDRVQHDQQVRDEAYERAAGLLPENYNVGRAWAGEIRNLKGTKS